MNNVSPRAWAQGSPTMRCLTGSLPANLATAAASPRAASAGPAGRHPGLIYILCVPLLAGVATVRGVSIGDFNYSGVLWAIAFAVGVLLWLRHKEKWPGQRGHFPVRPWLLWLGFVGLSFLWVDKPGFLQVQYALQLGMPVLVGFVASLVVRSREQLAEVVRAYFFSLVLLAFFAGLCLAGVLSRDELDPVFVAVRPLSLTAVVIGALFAAGARRRFVAGWLGWAACLTITAVTGSRMASLAMLVIPILNPLTGNLLRKATALLIVGLIGVGVFFTPYFQGRFFYDESGDIGQLASGEFNTAGRFETWPLVLDEALKHPWLGHGVGSVQIFMPTVWEDMMHPHNDYLRLLFEFGVVGLVLFLSVVFWQLWMLGRQVRRTSGLVQQVFGGAWLGLATFLVIAITDNPIIYHVWYMNPVFALIGAAYGVAGEEKYSGHSAEGEGT